MHTSYAVKKCSCFSLHYPMLIFQITRILFQKKNGLNTSLLFFFLNALNFGRSVG